MLIFLIKTFKTMLIVLFCVLINNFIKKHSGWADSQLPFAQICISCGLQWGWILYYKIGADKYFSLYIIDFP